MLHYARADTSLAYIQGAEVLTKNQKRKNKKHHKGLTNGAQQLVTRRDNPAWARGCARKVLHHLAVAAFASPLLLIRPK